MRILIFEGHDKAGKSTIVRALQKKLMLKGYKTGVFADNFLGIACEDIFDKKFSMERARYCYSVVKNLVMFSESNSIIIFDRFHLSETVYGTVLKRGVLKTMIEAIDETLAGLGAKIIYCSKQTVDKEDEYLTKSQVEEAKLLYEEEIKKTQCDVLHLDTTSENLAEQLQKILEWLGADYEDRNL